ncbi:amidohydrolase [uncultured Psychroserpens sp.]|uniref:amidohydrolase n=1 Tax=uncultured Psychroserpens sp. TaxID=255436 RepID=UPI002617862F|nr:amidohydrolase [uncultured Psychroserpens sp.]
MKDDLTIALFQTNLIWEHPEQNRINLGKKISTLTKPVDVIVLPEMFTSGFTMNASSVAESMNGTTVSWMQDLAKQTYAAITGSIVIKEDDKYYNRLLFVHPDGRIDCYNKKHTFTLAGEHEIYQSGNSISIINYKGWKIKPLICYDLRFPVWSRNVEGYDLLLYVANWPKVRINAWNALLKARAIENMSYCVGVNRVGLDANNHEYSGHSAIYDTLGERLDTTPNDKEAVEIVTLHKSHIETYRNKLGFLNDKDAFSLK